MTNHQSVSFVKIQVCMKYLEQTFSNAYTTRATSSFILSCKIYLKSFHFITPEEMMQTDTMEILYNLTLSNISVCIVLIRRYYSWNFNSNTYIPYTFFFFRVTISMRTNPFVCSHIFCILKNVTKLWVGFFAILLHGIAWIFITYLRCMTERPARPDGWLTALVKKFVFVRLQ